jgi:hypothetical protein
VRTAARFKKLAVLCLRLTTKDNGRYNPNRVGRGHRACDVQLAQGRRSKPGHRAGRYASVVGSAARQSVLGTLPPTPWSPNLAAVRLRLGPSGILLAASSGREPIASVADYSNVLGACCHALMLQSQKVCHLLDRYSK